jgi:hypothetical protein
MRGGSHTPTTTTVTTIITILMAPAVEKTPANATMPSR